MPFSVEEAFAAFESPGEVVERQRAETNERLADRAVELDQSTQERAASRAGAEIAGAFKGLTGFKSRDERVAAELEIAAKTIAGAESHDADVLTPGDAQASLEAEQERIALTGSQAEAKYLEQGLSKDEAQLAAFDDVIAGSQIPEVARQLVYMKATAAAEIAEKRKNIAVLKATGTDEEIDRRLAEAEAQKAEQVLVDRGNEVVQLQAVRDEKLAAGANPDSPTIQELTRRINQLAPFPEEEGGEDPVLKRHFDKGIVEESNKAQNALDQIVNIQNAYETEPNSNTVKGLVAGYTTNLLQDIEAFWPNSRKNLEDNLGLVDFAQFGRDAAAARQLAELMILSQTDTQIKGIPSNIDMAKIEQAVGRDIKDPVSRAKIFENLTLTTMSRFRNYAYNANRVAHPAAVETERRWKHNFVDEPARRKREQEMAEEKAANADFDFTNTSTEDLLNELEGL